MDETLSKTIADLDLKSVRDQLKKKKGFWWNYKNNMETLEKEYKQFLYLVVANQTKLFTPWSEALDEFWHTHILDTRKYKEDCKKLGVDYIHHNPNLPIRTPEQKTAFGETKKIYKETFGKKESKTMDSGNSSGLDCGVSPLLFYPLVFCASSSHHSDNSSVHHSDSSDVGHSGHNDGDHGHDGGSGGHSCGGSFCSSCGGDGGGD